MLLTTLAMLVAYGLFALGSVFVFQPSDRSARWFRAVITIFGTLAALYFGYLTVRSNNRLCAFASLFLFGVSIVLFVASLDAIGKRKIGFAGGSTAPTSFVRTGPYSRIRHPIYVAYLIGWVAGLLNATSSLEWAAGIMLLTIMASIYAVAAILEEKAIAASTLRFAYSEYAAQTGMFVPRRL